jgi:hypothetical protein
MMAHGRVELIVEVEVTLRLTVSQRVYPGVEPTLGLVTRYYFLSEGCCLVSVGAPSLTRGRVCSFQYNHSMVLVAQNP